MQLAPQMHMTSEQLGKTIEAVRSFLRRARARQARGDKDSHKHKLDADSSESLLQQLRRVRSTLTKSKKQLAKSLSDKLAVSQRLEHGSPEHHGRIQGNLLFSFVFQRHLADLESHLNRLERRGSH